MSKDRPRDGGIFRAVLTWSGVSVAFHSRAVSNLDRLLGALLGILAACLETVENRIRSRARRESALQDAAVARMGAAITSGEAVTRGVAELALSSRVSPTVDKVRLSELPVNEPFLNPTGRKSLDPEGRREPVDPE